MLYVSFLCAFLRRTSNNVVGNLPHSIAADVRKNRVMGTVPFCERFFQVPPYTREFTQIVHGELIELLSSPLLVVTDMASKMLVLEQEKPFGARHHIEE